MKGQRIVDFKDLLEAAGKIRHKRVIVVFANHSETFEAIANAQKNLDVSFTLTGEREIIEHGISNAGGDLSRINFVDEPDPLSALDTSLQLIQDEKGDILMKGSIDTGTMMREVLNEKRGIRTGRLLSDIFLFEYPKYEENKFVMITDGGMTLSPDLMNKVELINNAVEVAHALGNTKPKVAVLSATEFITPKLQSTLDAAVLAKMNERGQIKGCIVDGPLALDNAISKEAADEKGIRSPVAGRAEILIAHHIETANSLAKSTTYFADVRLAHVIIGARVPILIPSRADKSEAKLLSIALGMIMSEFMKKGKV